MKIDVNVKLYLIDDEVKTEEEFKAEIKECVNDEMTAFQSGEFYDGNREFDAFMNNKDLDYRDLVNAIFNQKIREDLIKGYRDYLTEGYTDNAYDEHIEIEKTIQVEI